MAVAVAVISKENAPLYVRTQAGANHLKFLYTIYTSLDVVEEKVAPTKTTADIKECYLGLLYPTEDYKVYGYLTNTWIKFIIIVESALTTLRENDIRQMYRKLHNAYTDLVSNSFYTPGDTISSRAFETVVKSIMGQE